MFNLHQMRLESQMEGRRLYLSYNKESCVEITKKLDKKSVIYLYTIYTNLTWSVLPIKNPTLKYIYCL